MGAIRKVFLKLFSSHIPTQHTEERNCAFVYFVANNILSRKEHQRVLLYVYSMFQAYSGAEAVIFIKQSGSVSVLHSPDDLQR